MNDGALVELVGVSKSYSAARRGGDVPVLRDLSLSVAAGESLAIVGPSGSGKSTLLNLIGGLDRPDSGLVRVGGKDLTSCSDDDLAEIRSRRIGFVFQQHHLLPQCTLIENVLIPALIAGQADRAHSDRAKLLLERVGLSGRAKHRPGQLSGGERQRVAVVRALINEPKLLLADEPTGSLDRASADDLADLLAQLNQADGVTLITVTHSPQLAGRMARRLTLRDGALREEGGAA